MASVEAADGEETGVEDLRTIVEYKFRQLIEYLQREEIALKALRAVDLKSCLRTGAGTKGHAADAERMKFYRMFNKISKDLTPEQRQQVLDWESRICSSQEAEQSVKTPFQLIEILENAKQTCKTLEKHLCQNVSRVTKAILTKTSSFVKKIRPKSCIFD